MSEIQRALVSILLERLQKGPPFLQIVLGPRQVGKTTALRQMMRQWKGHSHYASADLPSPPDVYWIQLQWQLARQQAQEGSYPTLLVLDEVQKIPRWAEVVKSLYDEDKHQRLPLRVVLLGSSSLQIQHGSHESLAGRFEIHFCSHWSWPECRKALSWDWKQWILYGGYPGAARLATDNERWKSYVSDSLIESVLSRDVLQMAPIAKPALLRQLFMLATRTPAQILSYNKMLGQLQDAGNTVTLAHYLELLSKAYLISGLPLWSGGITRVRASSPKIVLWNNALITAVCPLSDQEIRKQPEFWGRLVENAVGGHLLNQKPSRMELFYWRKDNSEVDYVLEYGQKLLALEIKSGLKKKDDGLETFCRHYPKAKALRVGTGGVPFEQFFASNPKDWF